MTCHAKDQAGVEGVEDPDLAAVEPIAVRRLARRTAAGRRDPSRLPARARLPSRGAIRRASARDIATRVVVARVRPGGWRPRASPGTDRERRPVPFPRRRPLTPRGRGRARPPTRGGGGRSTLDRRVRPRASRRTPIAGHQVADATGRALPGKQLAGRLAKSCCGLERSNSMRTSPVKISVASAQAEDPLGEDVALHFAGARLDGVAA